jgi:hypothetical protein
VKLSMSAAQAVVLEARKDLGPDLGGMSVVDLLAEQFIEDSIADCVRVARQLQQDGAI